MVSHLVFPIHSRQKVNEPQWLKAREGSLEDEDLENESRGKFKVTTVCTEMRLPPELFIMMAEYISHRKTLANLCRVSQDLSSIFTPWLYRHVRIGSNFRVPARIWEHLMNGKCPEISLLRYTQSMKVDFCVTHNPVFQRKLARAIGLMPRLRSLYVKAHGHKLCTSAIPDFSESELIINEVRIIGRDITLHLGPRQAFPIPNPGGFHDLHNLQNLHLGFVLDWADRRSFSGVRMKGIKIAKQLLLCPQLKSLALSCSLPEITLELEPDELIVSIADYIYISQTEKRPFFALEELKLGYLCLPASPMDRSDPAVLSRLTDVNALKTLHLENSFLSNNRHPYKQEDFSNCKNLETIKVDVLCSDTAKSITSLIARKTPRLKNLEIAGFRYSHGNNFAYLNRRAKAPWAFGTHWKRIISRQLEYYQDETTALIDHLEYDVEELYVSSHMCTKCNCKVFRNLRNLPRLHILIIAFLNCLCLSTISTDREAKARVIFLEHRGEMRMRGRSSQLRYIGVGTVVFVCMWPPLPEKWVRPFDNEWEDIEEHTLSMKYIKPFDSELDDTGEGESVYIDETTNLDTGTYMGDQLVDILYHEDSKMINDTPKKLLKELQTPPDDFELISMDRKEAIRIPGLVKQPDLSA